MCFSAVLLEETTVRFTLIFALTGALAGLAPLAEAQKDPDQAGVAEAIRFERAKQAAADRQAHIEAAQARGAKSEEKAAATPKTKTKTVRTASASGKRTHQPQQ